MQIRPNQVLAAVTALVVALAVLAGALAATRPAPDVTSDAPESVAQAYALAVLTADRTRAAELLDPDRDCDLVTDAGYGPPGNATVTVVSSQVSGRTATVTLEITEYYSEVLNSWSHREEIELLDTGSGWRVTGDPWPIYGCR